MYLWIVLATIGFLSIAGGVAYVLIDEYQNGSHTKRREEKEEGKKSESNSFRSTAYTLPLSQMKNDEVHLSRNILDQLDMVKWGSTATSFRIESNIIPPNKVVDQSIDLVKYSIEMYSKTCRVGVPDNFRLGDFLTFLKSVGEVSPREGHSLELSYTEILNQIWPILSNRSKRAFEVNIDEVRQIYRLRRIDEDNRVLILALLSLCLDSFDTKVQGDYNYVNVENLIFISPVHKKIYYEDVLYLNNYIEFINRRFQCEVPLEEVGMPELKPEKLEPTNNGLLLSVI